MQVFHDLDHLPKTLQGGVVSIGKFDGVHLGHVLIIHRLKSHAGRLRTPSIILTFDPSPVSVLRPDLNVKPICTLERKIELIEMFGIDAIIVLKATKDFLFQSAETFFFSILSDLLKAKVVVEGRNFTFGRDQIGNADTIQSYGRWADIEIDIVEPVQLGEKIVSSSGIRRMLSEGNIEYVNELMSLPYQLRGTVVEGDRRGRTLGFPTANLENIETIIPKPGVYACLVHANGHEYYATTSVGPNPTFDIFNNKVEIFLHDFEGNLYGTDLRVDLLSYQREIKRFESREDLIFQMQTDVDETRKTCDSIRRFSEKRV